MKKKTQVFLILAFTFLFMGCNPPHDVKSESDKIFRMGVNGNISFKNILPSERYTKYGYGEIRFEVEGETSTYAIFSVPAEENNAETYFHFVVEAADESSPDFVICMYDKKSSQKLNYSLWTDTGLKPFPVHLENRTGHYLIRVAGNFERYKQENLIVMGTDSRFESENSRLDINAFIDAMDNKEKKQVMKNTAYVVAYPWRTVKVLVTDGFGRIENSNCVDSMINYANTVLRQGLCRLKAATDTNDYDVKIILSSTTPSNRNVIFYDEANKEYSFVTSNRFSHALVKQDCLHEEAENHAENDTMKRSFTYAVAYLLGVTLIEDERESEKTLHHNLMDTNNAGTHLSFRQWNQLHIRRDN